MGSCLHWFHTYDLNGLIFVSCTSIETIDSETSYANILAQLSYANHLTICFFLEASIFCVEACLHLSWIFVLHSNRIEAMPMYIVLCQHFVIHIQTQELLEDWKHNSPLNSNFFISFLLFKILEMYIFGGSAKLGSNLSFMIAACYSLHLIYPK